MLLSLLIFLFVQSVVQNFIEISVAERVRQGWGWRSGFPPIGGSVAVFMPRYRRIRTQRETSIMIEDVLDRD